MVPSFVQPAGGVVFRSQWGRGRGPPPLFLLRGGLSLSRARVPFRDAHF